MFTDKLIDKLKLEKTKFVPARSASLPKARAKDILETFKKT